MNIHISIPWDQLKGKDDPILDVIPILENAGYKLCGNGVLFGDWTNNERFLEFEIPEGAA
jgi:hypothetical protein